MKPTSIRRVEDKHECPLAPGRSPTRGSRCHKWNSEPDQGQSSPLYSMTSVHYLVDITTAGVGQVSFVVGLLERHLQEDKN